MFVVEPLAPMTGLSRFVGADDEPIGSYPSDESATFPMFKA